MRTNRPYVQIDPDVLERVRQIDLLSYLREFEPTVLTVRARIHYRKMRIVRTVRTSALCAVSVCMRTTGKNEMSSDFKSFCVAYMVSSRYGVDTRGFDFSRLPESMRKWIRRHSRESLARCVMFWAKSRAICIRVWKRTSLQRTKSRNANRR